MLKAIVAALVAVSFQRSLNVSICNKVKCTIRSYLLHVQTNTSSQSLLRVDVDNSGVPTGVSLTGQSSQSKYTVFHLKHCVLQIGSTPKLVTTFHWKHNQSYTLVVKSSQIALELVSDTASVTDSHRFFMRDVRCGTGSSASSVASCKTMKSVLPAGGYITASTQGRVTLHAPSRRDRRAWFLMSCAR